MINIVIPMAGSGMRFANAGYKKPKPLVEVFNKPMIEQVINSLNIDGQYIFLVQKKDIEQHNIDIVLKNIKKDCKIIIIDGLTLGAAATTLLAQDEINNENLIIANSDQIIEWDSASFVQSINDNDGSILVFNETDPKWSFAKVENGIVTRVAEKDPISDIATVGVYGWKNGLDYIKYANQMINKNIKTNGEFYVCPVYNEAIEDNKRIVPFFVNKMHGVGTPEDLDKYINA